MSRSLSFTAAGWEDYVYWQTHDKQILRKLNMLIKDCQRSPFSGIGKPEQLRHELSGAWSRRVSDEHRLVYLATDNDIQILACRYHY